MWVVNMKSIRYISFWGLTRDHHCWHLPLITIANIYHLPHCQIHLQEMLRMWSSFIWTLPMSCLILQMTLISLYIRRSSLKLFINRWSCCTWEIVFSIRHIYLARSQATFSWLKLSLWNLFLKGGIQLIAECFRCLDDFSLQASLRNCKSLLVSLTQLKAMSVS